MKNKAFLCFWIFLLLLFSAGIASAENLPDPNALLSDADETRFLRPGLVQDFSEDQGYVNEILKNNIIHQWYIYDGKGTDVLFSLFPAAEPVMTGNKRLYFPGIGVKDFHVTLSLRRSEDVPAGGGGNCWIRYTDELLSGKGYEQGLILYPGDKACAIVAGTEYEIVDLSALSPDEPIKFDFIRLDDTVYVYADGIFIFSYEDGISGGISFDAGSRLFASGNRIRCDFDDFSVRF